MVLVLIPVLVCATHRFLFTLALCNQCYALHQQAKQEAEKRHQTKQELNRKIEDKLLPNLKPLPPPLMVPTPEVMVLSLFPSTRLFFANARLWPLSLSQV